MLKSRGRCWEGVGQAAWGGLHGGGRGANPICLPHLCELSRSTFCFQIWTHSAAAAAAPELVWDGEPTALGCENFPFKQAAGCLKGEGSVQRIRWGKSWADSHASHCGSGAVAALLLAASAALCASFIWGQPEMEKTEEILWGNITATTCSSAGPSLAAPQCIAVSLYWGQPAGTVLEKTTRLRVWILKLCGTI